MKRSKCIRLILLGGLSVGALTGCEQKPAVSAEQFYTNNFYIPGAGYYHAPFRAWYSFPTITLMRRKVYISMAANGVPPPARASQYFSPTQKPCNSR